MLSPVFGKDTLLAVTISDYRTVVAKETCEDLSMLLHTMLDQSNTLAFAHCSAFIQSTRVHIVAFALTWHCPSVW